jgi:hypothetical protein
MTVGLDNNSNSEEESSNKRQPMGELSNTVFKKARPNTQPRWHSQSYMVFLALRDHPDHCLPRNELLHAAVNMDKKISKELGLPRVFKGKVSGEQQ